MSDLNYLMKPIADKARRMGMVKSKPTEKEARDMYMHCSDAIHVDEVTPMQRSRRRGQLSWKSIVNLIRKANASDSLVIM
ncbi:unnamed protein product, partial [Aphanomyces euteiches]